MQLSQRGFTMIELMITLIIAAIMLSLAVPAFYSMIQNNRMVALTNNFISNLQLARSEAIRRGAIVTMCPASDATQTQCGSSANWENGWIVFLDTNNDGVVDDSNDRIKVMQALETGSDITSPADRVTFSNVGFVTTGSGSFTMQMTECSGQAGRIVNLATSGRTAVSTYTCS